MSTYGGFETEERGVLPGERERLLRDVDACHIRVGPLVLHGERNRSGADTDVEDAGGVDALEERKHALDDDLRLGPGHERACVRLQHQAAKAPGAEDVGKRLSHLAAHEQRLGSPDLAFVERPLGSGVELAARQAEHVADDPLRFAAGVLDARAGETACSTIEQVARRHRVAHGLSPKARACVPRSSTLR